MVEIEEAAYGVTENNGVDYCLGHRISVFWQVGAAAKHADVPGAGSKAADGPAREEQKSEAEAEGDVDKKAERQVEEALPEVHTVESKRLQPGRDCMPELVEVVELQQAGDTGGGVAASASCSGFHNHNLHKVHSALLAVVLVETLAIEHCKVQADEHEAVALLLRTTNPNSLADLAEEVEDQAATGAAEAYNLALAEKDFCSLLWQVG